MAACEETYDTSEARGLVPHCRSLVSPLTIAVARQARGVGGRRHATLGLAALTRLLQVTTSD